MTGLLRTQRGMTFTGVVVVVVLIVSAALAAMKIVPIYMRHSTIKSVMNGFKTEPGVSKMDVRTIKKMIVTRMNINSVYDYDPDSMEVKKDPKRILISTDYEVRKDLVGNIDVVVKFSYETEIPIL